MAKSYRKSLIEARALIEDESRWVHHRGAVDAMGYSVMPLDDEACCWCAVGALHKVTGTMHGRAINGPLAYLALASRNAGYISATDANDKGGHGIMLDIFDEAIKLAGRRTT